VCLVVYCNFLLISAFYVEPGVSAVPGATLTLIIIKCVIAHRLEEEELAKKRKNGSFF